LRKQTFSLYVRCVVPMQNHTCSCDNSSLKFLAGRM